MSYRGPQQGCSLLESTDTRKGYDLNISGSFAGHLINERSHPIDAGITRRDDNNHLSLFGLHESLLCPLAFVFHSCINTLATFAEKRLHKLKIVSIANNHISLLQCGLNCRSDIFWTSWA